MATYYVSTSGSNAAAGTSEGAAWLTIDKGMNTVAAGDKVWVKADGNYAELATIDTVGTTTAPIVFEGYTTTTGDGGRATITGSSTRANCVADSIAANTNIYYVFKNFRFTAATGIGFSTDCNVLVFKNCKFDNNGSHGLSCRLVSGELCEFSSNGGSGVLGNSGSQGGSLFIGCKFYSNGATGLSAGSFSSVLFGCIFFSNATDNLWAFGGTNSVCAVINCVFDGDSKDSDIGISMQANAWVGAIINSIFYDCATGISSDVNVGEQLISRNNLVNANTTAYVNAATFTGEVTSAPQFTNEVGGADYTPAAGSPLINAGFDGGS